MGYKIASAEQLIDLPDKSIVIGSDGIAYQKLQGISNATSLAWYSTCSTAATHQGLLEHHEPLTLVHIPHSQGEHGAAITDPDYLRTQSTMADVIHIPAPRPKDDAGSEGRYSESNGIKHKAMVTAEETLYIALGPDHDTDALARRLIGELEYEGCLAATQGG